MKTLQNCSSFLAFSPLLQFHQIYKYRELQQYKGRQKEQLEPVLCINFALKPGKFWVHFHMTLSMYLFVEIQYKLKIINSIEEETATKNLSNFGWKLCKLILHYWHSRHFCNFFNIAKCNKKKCGKAWANIKYVQILH